MLIVANHPNSFLDAIIIAAQCKYRVHFLARGDVFSKPWHYKLLSFLNMMPVYRLSEGKENLGLNQHSFDRSKSILAANGIVLVFIEGICINSHELQPFKKGAARIALMAAAEKINLSILPVAIAYDSLKGPGKTIFIAAGAPALPELLLPYPNDDAKNKLYFNQQLFITIHSLVTIPQTQNKTGISVWDKIAGILGYVFHLIPYTLTEKIVRKKTKGTVFYDSVLFSAILLLYPLYLLLLGLVLYCLHVSGYLVLLIILLHPPMAWCAIQCLPYFNKNKKDQDV